MVADKGHVLLKSGDFDGWLQNKFKKYKTCLVQSGLIFNKVQNNIINLCKQNSFPDKLGRYLKLIVSVLIGVPQWSCELTNLYFLVKTRLEIQKINAVIKSINDAIYPSTNI